LLLGLLVVGWNLGGYFFYDDFYFLYWVSEQKPSFLSAFERWETGMWCPLFVAWFWLQHRLFDTWALGYHALDGVLFLGAIFVFHRVMELLTHSRATALLAALFFAGSYNHWEAVYWISASSELWMGFLGLCLWGVLLRDDFLTRPLLPWLAFGLYLLALLAKESAVMLLPLAVVLLALAHKLHILKTKFFCLSLLLPSVCMMVWHAFATQQGASFQSGIFEIWGSHLIINIGRFLTRLAFPFLVVPPVGFSLLCLGSFLLALLFWIGWKNRALACWGGFILLAILPYGIIHIPDYYPTRYLYLASIGFSAWLAVGLDQLSRRLSCRAWILTGVFCLYGVMNAWLFIAGADLAFFRKDDSLNRQVVQQLHALQLPPVSKLGVEGVNEHLTHVPPYSLIYLLALALDHPSPELVYDRGWETQPVDLILTYDGQQFSVKAPPGAAP
jgi:hypothetical protein